MRSTSKNCNDQAKIHTYSWRDRLGRLQPLSSVATSPQGPLPGPAFFRYYGTWQHALAAVAALQHQSIYNDLDFSSDVFITTRDRASVSSDVFITTGDGSRRLRKGAPLPGPGRHIHSFRENYVLES